MGNYIGKTRSEYYAEWQKKNKKRQNAYKLSWRKNNLEKVRKQALNWYYRQIGNPDFKELVKQRSRDYGKSHPEWVKERNRILCLQRLGITKEDLNKLMELQEGKCAICETKQSCHGKKRLAVDHDHKTGKVRGLLCHDCNWMIGYLERRTDKPTIITKLAEYLITHNNWE